MCRDAASRSWQLRHRVPSHAPSYTHIGLPLTEVDAWARPKPGSTTPCGTYRLLLSHGRTMNQPSHFVAASHLVFFSLAVACSSESASTPPHAADGSIDDSRATIDAESMVDAAGDMHPEGGSGSTPTIGGCPVFTSDDAWNRDVTGEAVDGTWTQKLYANATLKSLHPDFGTAFGIPFNIVPATQPPLAISFTYASESDPGPYPFPGTDAKIEGGTPANCTGDCHVLAIEEDVCLLYEGWACHFATASGSWRCGSGAKFDLTKNSYGQRPVGWTSADAAGLPIFPGLVKYSEVAAGEVKHAIRFTMHCTQDGYIVPATHQAVPSQCPSIPVEQLRSDYPPLGLRMRLKATYDISALPSQALVVAQAMKTYGMILADNGSDYYFQGDANPNWNDDQIGALKAIPANAFEVLTPGPIQR